MTSFTEIDKEKIDLLLKKALGFRYTTSNLIPGQENFQTSFILNEQVFSKKLPTENALSYNGVADKTYTQNGGEIAYSYPMSVPSGFGYIKKYTNIRLSVVPGTENRAWEPFTVTDGEDSDILKTKATQSIIGNAKFKFLLSVDGVTVNPYNSQYSPVINNGIMIFFGNTVPNANSTIFFLELYVYDGNFGASVEINEIDLPWAEFFISTSTEVFKLSASPGNTTYNIIQKWIDPNYNSAVTGISINSATTSGFYNSFTLSATGPYKISTNFSISVRWMNSAGDEVPCVFTVAILFGTVSGGSTFLSASETGDNSIGKYISNGNVISGSLDVVKYISSGTVIGLGIKLDDDFQQSFSNRFGTVRGVNTNTNTIVLDSTESSLSDSYNGYSITINNEVRQITDYVVTIVNGVTTRNAILDSNFTTVPTVGTSTYRLSLPTDTYFSFNILKASYSAHFIRGVPGPTGATGPTGADGADGTNFSSSITEIISSSYPNTVSTIRYYTIANLTVNPTVTLQTLLFKWNKNNSNGTFFKEIHGEIMIVTYNNSSGDYNYYIEEFLLTHTANGSINLEKFQVKTKFSPNINTAINNGEFSFLLSNSYSSTEGGLLLTVKSSFLTEAAIRISIENHNGNADITWGDEALLTIPSGYSSNGRLLFTSSSTSNKYIGGFLSFPIHFTTERVNADVYFSVVDTAPDTTKSVEQTNYSVAYSASDVVSTAVKKSVRFPSGEIAVSVQTSPSVYFIVTPETNSASLTTTVSILSQNSPGSLISPPAITVDGSLTQTKTLDSTNTLVFNLSYNNILKDTIAIYKLTLNLMAFTNIGFFLASSVNTTSGTWTSSDNGTYPGTTSAGHTVTVTGGTGTGISVQISFDNFANPIINNIANQGSGYSVGDVITITKTVGTATSTVQMVLGKTMEGIIEYYFVLYNNTISSYKQFDLNSLNFTIPLPYYDSIANTLTVDLSNYANNTMSLNAAVTFDKYVGMA